MRKPVTQDAVGVSAEQCAQECDGVDGFAASDQREDRARARAGEYPAEAEKRPPIQYR